MTANISISGEELQKIFLFSIRKQFYLSNFSGFLWKFRRIVEPLSNPDLGHIVIVIISVVPRPSVNTWHVPCAKCLRGSQRVVLPPCG
jgi:hypothetical protein